MGVPPPGANGTDIETFHMRNKSQKMKFNETFPRCRQLQCDDSVQPANCSACDYDGAHLIRVVATWGKEDGVGGIRMTRGGDAFTTAAATAAVAVAPRREVRDGGGRGSSRPGHADDRNTLSSGKVATSA